MAKTRVMVLRCPGSNCDHDAVHAWIVAGADVDHVHLNRWVEHPRLIQDYQILTIPGGFSYGDDIAAGQIFATRLRLYLVEQIHEFVERGRLVLGICNGFQILAKAGLLPGLGATGPKVTLTANAAGHFEDRWIRMQATITNSPWLKDGDFICAPVAHGEGRVVFDSVESWRRVVDAGLVALRYVSIDGTEAVYPQNPNGSTDNIAGLTDPTGRILGLMPHPERHMDRVQNPLWTRMAAASDRLPEEHGFRVFQRGVGYFR